MFGTLFIKECSQVLRSLVFYIFLVIFVLFVNSQMGEIEQMKKPEPYQSYYGLKSTTDHKDIIERTLALLVDEIDMNNFGTTPLGLYKKVILKEDELSKLRKIVEKNSGKSWKEVQEEKTEHFSIVNESSEDMYMEALYSYRVSLEKEADYRAFQKDMEVVCDIVGRGSSYEEEYYKYSTAIPMTYEEALDNYAEICSKDGITEAYMRLFCDYAGIILAIFPIFVGVTRCVRDRRSKAEQVIYSSAASSTKIILSRYLANVFMVFIPVVVLAYLLQIPYMYQAKSLGVTPHNFAFLSYSVIWLLPSIAFVLAMSFLLTELFNGIVAIIGMSFFGIGAFVMSGSLKGDFGWGIVLRWNVFGNASAYWENIASFYQNRICYLILAVVAVFVTVLIYSYKRKGGGVFVKNH